MSNIDKASILRATALLASTHLSALVITDGKYEAWTNTFVRDLGKAAGMQIRSSWTQGKNRDKEFHSLILTASERKATLIFQETSTAYELFEVRYINGRTDTPLKFSKDYKSVTGKEIIDLLASYFKTGSPLSNSTNASWARVLTEISAIPGGIFSVNDQRQVAEIPTDPKGRITEKGQELAMKALESPMSYNLIPCPGGATVYLVSRAATNRLNLRQGGLSLNTFKTQATLLSVDDPSPYLLVSFG